MQGPRGAGSAQNVIRTQMQAGMAALQDGKLDDARNIFSLVLEANPELALAQVGLGRVYALEGVHDRALEHFQAALKIKPDFAPAIMFSAQAREKLGQTDDAMDEYRHAVELDPKLSLGYFRMARGLVTEGRNDEALSTLRDAVAHSPQDASLRLMLANALDRSGENAEAEYRHVIDLKPDLWIAHFQLGRAMLNDGRFDQARDSLARAVTLAADKPQVHQALGSAYVGLGDHVRAVKSFDEAYRLKPSNVLAAVKGAQSRSALGKHREAMDLLLNLGRMARRSAIVQRAMGDVYFATSKWAEAAECYRAMVLNSEEITKNSPELIAMVNKPAGTNPEADAKALHAAVTERADTVGKNLRDDPTKARNWLRDRRAGRAAR